MSTTKKPPQTYNATLIANKRRVQAPDSTEDVRELVIEVGQPRFQCFAGQSIGVVLPPDPNAQESFHLRWYSIADIPAVDDQKRTSLVICVRRIVSAGPDGQTQRGWASNFLCDAEPGTSLQLTEPQGLPFPIPKEKDASIILIGAGTGVAPFRMFVKTIYRNHPDSGYSVRLFYGIQNGLDVLYANDPEKDLTQYFDKETFEAFKALSPPIHWADPITWDLAFSERGDELLKMMEQPNTYVYVAGRKDVGDKLDQFLASLKGSANQWALKKGEMKSAGRWTELLY